MKKKLSLLLCTMLTFVTMLLAACGTDPKTVDYNGYSYDDLLSIAQGNISTLASMTETDKEYYMSQGQEIFINMIQSWDEAVKDVGAYQGFGEFTIAKSGKTLSTEQIVLFENKNVSVTYVYNYNDMKLTGITIDKVYSLGEKMSKAGLNTLMGMGTVFVVLILISLIIYCFNIIPYLEKKKKSGKVSEEVVAVPAAAPVVQETVADDLELIAVISAAIAAMEGTSTDSFVVRSIRRR